MIFPMIKKIRRKLSEMEIKRYRAKAQQYRDEAAKELNIHMKTALKLIARKYDARADKAEAAK